MAIELVIYALTIAITVIVRSRYWVSFTADHFQQQFFYPALIQRASQRQNIAAYQVSSHLYLASADHEHGFPLGLQIR
jgi:hypothetical protein